MIQKRTTIYTEKQDLLFGELAELGIDKTVTDAFRQVPRDLFVPEAFQGRAFENSALPIACGQTISQPYTVALMTQLLDVRAGNKVLEIGTGSGFQAAILATLGAEVYTVERHEPLHLRAKKLLSELGYSVHCILGDGSTGAAQHAPFDRIIVTAASPDVPPSLLEQLAEGGKLLIPLGDKREQRLCRYTRRFSGFHKEDFGTARFVPLIGQEGWSA